MRGFEAETGDQTFEWLVAEATFTGGVRVAAADVNRDGYPDVVAGMGPGGGPRVTVLDGLTGEPLPGVLGSFYAYDPSFTGGVFVAADDVTGDHVPDVITAAGVGGSPHVKVFDGKTGSLLASFMAFAPDFRGGATIAAADFDRDGKAELAIGAGPGGGPHVKVIDPLTGTVERSFFAFDESFEGGVSVGADTLAGDVDADGHPDLVVGTGAGGASRVKVFGGADNAVVADFAPFASSMTAGVTVALAYVDDDAFADPVVGTGPGVDSTVRVFSGATGSLITGPSAEFLPFGAGATGGVTVGASNDPNVPAAYSPTIDNDSPALGQAFQVTGELKMVSKLNAPPLGVVPTGDVTFSAYNVSTGTTTLGAATLGAVDSVTSSATLVLPLGLTVAGTYDISFDYPGDTYYTAATSGTTSLTITSSALAPVAALAPEDAACVTCPCPDLVTDAGGGSRTVKPAGTSAAGVKYGSGWGRAVRTDLFSSGFGSWWGMAASWSSLAGFGDLVSGSGWTQSQAVFLVQIDGDASVGIVANGGCAYAFDEYGGSFKSRFGGAATFDHDATNGVFTLTNDDGSVLTFYDFSGGTPSGRAGKLKKSADPAGGVTEVTSWDGSGRPTEVQRVQGSGGSALTESFLTAYLASGPNAGLVDTVTQRTRVGTGSWSTVRSSAYTYYTSSTTYGKAGDLMFAEVKDASGTTIDKTYYRYYTSGGSGGGSGARNLMKFAFGPAAYARLIAALGTGVDSLSDAQVDDYADQYLEYDATDRVVRAVDAAAGCSVCAGGLGEFTYTYSSNANGPGVKGDANRWDRKTVETLPDGNTNTVYTNVFGQVVLSVYTDTTTSQVWRRYTGYDGSGRAVLEAGPETVTGFSESNNDLVGYSSGNASYLSDTVGQVAGFTYASSTTATTSSAGDAVGYLKQVDIRRGETGTAVPQSAQAYILRTAGGVDSVFPASSTVYRNDNGTGGQNTSVSYTWQGSTAQPESITVTMPTVTTAQNGPNSATTATSVFDAYGRVIWSKDQAGFLSYTEYDAYTGAVTKSIADVDHTLTGTFTSLPSGWTTPGGGGSHLTTTVEVDALGRGTKVTSPAGRVDYTVYNDANHEVRSYAGWNTSTNAPTGPTVVMREDRAGSYTETLTMSATPALNSGRPTGAESIGSLQSLSRSYTNAVGQVVTADTYWSSPRIVDSV